MSIPGSASPLFFTAAADAAAAGPIKSVRFNSDDSAYLNRTPSSAGNRKTWTWSAWVKRSKIGSRQYLFTAGIGTGSGESTYFRIAFENNDKFWVGTYNYNVRYTDMLFRDTSAWYHIVVKFDSTAATEANRCLIYVNGAEQSTTGSGLVQDADYAINSTEPHHFSYNSYYLDCYLADVYLIDGQALDPTSFGAFDDSGVWQAAAYSGSFGTNGFHLFDFANESGVGNDSSGNDNDWTVNNISTTAGAGNDVLFDVPTNGDSSDDTGAGGEVSGNYATLNPNITGTYISRSTLSNGNLQFVNTNYSTLPSTIAMSSGKWYCEGTLDALASASNQVWAGLLRTDAPNNAYEYFQGNNPTRGVHYWGDNTGLNRAQSYGVSYATAGTVIGIAFDADAGSCTWYVNGSSQGASTYNIVQGEEYYFSFGAYTNGAWTVNFGQRPFAYSAPSGYKPLCTTLLPTPTIADGSDYFDAKLYTGNGSTQTISGLEFSPDLVWIKSRSYTYDHLLLDQIRGAGNYLSSNTPSAEGLDSNSLTAFTSDGFSVGATNAVNQNNSSLVAWTWDAGDSTVSNTDGSQTANVRANQDAGFSICTFTQPTSGSSFSWGHGLNTAPEFVIMKPRSGSGNWQVYHKGAGTGYMWLNGTIAATGTGWSTINNSIVTATSTLWGGNYTTVAYCFAPVAGYSAFGSYTGNGSNDGPFISTGFRPAFLMLKRTDGAAGWYMYDYKRDGYNDGNKLLYANYSNAEANNSIPDLLSNGFKLRSLGSVTNGSGNDYIYMAFAENPFSSNGGLAR